jgi:hypothetical protein
MPAIIQILRGEAVLTLGSDTREAASGFLVYMPARLTHAVIAKIPVRPQQLDSDDVARSPTIEA